VVSGKLESDAMRFALLLLLIPAAMPGDDLSDLAREMLAAHNAARAKVQVKPLAWSADLARRAQEWANKLLEGNQLSHQKKVSYGQNLYETRGGRASAAKVVETWAAEASEYDYEKNRCRGQCGHYTQVVWSGTREIGCAVARNASREVWVCDYNPPGNYVGRRPY
jgi:pathogenesis-related protein 1